MADSPAMETMPDTPRALGELTMWPTAAPIAWRWPGAELVLWWEPAAVSELHLCHLLLRLCPDHALVFWLCFSAQILTHSYGLQSFTVLWHFLTLLRRKQEWQPLACPFQDASKGVCSCSSAGQMAFLGGLALSSVAECLCPSS